jgi:glutathionyl-hydroquinone reductase
MAKDKIAHVRSAKAKTPKQLAKKALNEARAAERFKRHQELDKQRLAQKQERAQQAAQANRDRFIIQSALNGPHAVILLRWLKGREATIDRVQRFCDDRPKFVRPNVAAIIAA